MLRNGIASYSYAGVVALSMHVLSFIIDNHGTHMKYMTIAKLYVVMRVACVIISIT